MSKLKNRRKQNTVLIQEQIDIIRDVYTTAPNAQKMRNMQSLIKNKVPEKYFSIVKHDSLNGIPINHKEVKMRNCLRCGKKFLSVAICFRICNHCKKLDSFRSSGLDSCDITTLA